MVKSASIVEALIIEKQNSILKTKSDEILVPAQPPSVETSAKEPKVLYILAAAIALWLIMVQLAVNVVNPSLEKLLFLSDTPAQSPDVVQLHTYYDVDIDSTNNPGVSTDKKYVNFILNHFPQEASQGRLPCALPDNTPFPNAKEDIISFAFGTSLAFVLIADMDQKSRDESTGLWHSYIKTGQLQYDRNTKKFTVDWIRIERLSTNIASNNRSIELSDLVWYNQKYLTVCDYTGIVYTIRPVSGDIFPRFILADGDGKSSRTFKAEWMAVHDDKLYIGSHGKEWVNDGVVIARGAEWVKIIDSNGRVTSVDWRERYHLLREAVGALSPGYLTHEAVIFHEIERKWVFLPRRHSIDTPFDDKTDAYLGTNLLLIVDEDFTDVQVKHVGPIEPQWGFSALTRIPGTSYLLAVKTCEIGDKTSSKITIFDIDGNILIDPPFIDVDIDMKFEGVAFIGPHESL